MSNTHKSYETLNSIPVAEASGKDDRQLADTFCLMQSVASVGPQMEGVIGEDALRVVRRPETVWGNIDELSVPVAFPIECDSLVNGDFYERRGGMEGVFALSSVVNLLGVSQLNQLINNLIENNDIRSLVVLGVEHPDGEAEIIELTNTARLIEALALIMPENPMIDSTSGSTAEVVHFTGLPEFTEPLSGSSISLQETFETMIDTGSAEVMPINGTSLLRPQDLTEDLVEKIWTMYDRQLDILVEDHPAYQRLDRELVVDMLRSQTGLNIVHFIDGQPVCLFIGVTDLETCDWLNAPLINERYPDDDVLYCPALVTDFEKQGHGYAANVFKLLTDIVSQRGRNVRPYFECTDISANYVPNIFTDALNATGAATVDVVALERYKYRRFDRL